MDLIALLRVLVRRWYLTLVLIVGSVVAVVAIVGTNPAGYKATGPIVLLPPTTASKPGTLVKVNPYLQLDGWQNIMTGLLAAQMVSEQFSNQVVAQHVRATWTVTQEAGVPILDLAVTDASSAAAVRATGIIFQEAQQSLHDMQTSAGAPPSQLATIQFATVPVKGTAQYGHNLKVGGALGIVLIGLSLAFVFSFDAVLERRKRRKKRPTTRRGAPRGDPDGGTTSTVEGTSTVEANPSAEPAPDAPSIPSPAAAPFAEERREDAPDLGFAHREH